MIPAELIQQARLAAESMMTEAVEIQTVSTVVDEQSNRVPGAIDTARTVGNLQHMTTGDVRMVADRLEGRAGYKLYVPAEMDPQQKGPILVNGDRYEVLVGMRAGSSLASYTKFLLVRINA